MLASPPPVPYKWFIFKAEKGNEFVSQSREWLQVLAGYQYLWYKFFKLNVLYMPLKLCMWSFQYEKDELTMPICDDIVRTCETVDAN